MEGDLQNEDFVKERGKTHLRLGVVHSLLDERDGSAELGGDVLGRALLDHGLERLEDTDLRAPAAERLEAVAEDDKDEPGRLGRADLDKRVERRLGRGPDRSRLLVEQVEEALEVGQEDSLGTGAEVDDQPTKGDGSVGPLLLDLGERPGADGVEDRVGREGLDVGPLDGERELVGLALGLGGVLGALEGDQELGNDGRVGRHGVGCEVGGKEGGAAEAAGGRAATGGGGRSLGAEGGRDRERKREGESAGEGRGPSKEKRGRKGEEEERGLSCVGCVFGRRA
jgi:hypothetical protein